MDISSVFMFVTGLGLFLFGMKLMSEGLELAAGARLRRLVEVLTTKRILGVLVGLVVTGVIQSSSATTVMVVGFVNAGIMSLSQSVGVIMGANIGTTVTSVLVAFNPAFIIPFVVLIGIILVTFVKRKSWQHVGQVLVGFGLLLLGLDMMSGGMAPLRDNESFKNLLTLFADNPLLGLLAGMAVTAVIQSSSASIGILQSLALAGAIGDVRAALFILYGQNIGTCVTALLSSIGTNKTAKRTAVVHLLFNVIGAVLFTVISIVLPFDQLLAFLAPGNVVAQIAIAHIIFNVTTTLLLYPFANVLVKVACLIVKGKDSADEEMRLYYLDERILNTPPIAVAQVLKEVERMAALAKKNVTMATDQFRRLDEKAVDEIYKREALINFLNHQITAYLVKINGLDLLESDSKTVGSLFHVVNDLERIGDHAENITEAAIQNHKNGYTISETALDEIDGMYEKVMKVFDLAMEMFVSRKYDEETVKVINEVESKIDGLADEVQESHIERLNQLKCSPASGMVFAKAVSNLERVADHSTNIAFSVNENN